MHNYGTTSEGQLCIFAGYLIGNVVLVLTILSLHDMKTMQQLMQKAVMGCTGSDFFVATCLHIDFAEAQTVAY